VAVRPGWADVAAVRAGRVWADINPDLLLRPGPRLVEGQEVLGARLAALRGSLPAGKKP
jgi:iron complex transport system substrate-binding protein